MRTVQDLVDNLNLNYDLVCRVERTDNGCYIEDDTSCFIHFEDGHWDIHGDFCMLHREVQKYIMDFVYTTDKEHWFDEPEKKYNIIIGEDVGQIYRSAYKKCWFGAKVSDNVHEEDLILENYQFTESEVEDLKSKVSERSAKIIDLGKVEVKG